MKQIKEVRIVKILFCDMLMGYMELINNHDLDDCSNDLKEYAKFCRMNEIMLTINGFHYWTQDKYNIDNNTYEIVNTIDKITDTYKGDILVRIKEIEVTKLHLTA